MAGLSRTPTPHAPPAPPPPVGGSPGALPPAPAPILRGTNAVLGDEQIRNILYNETRGLSGGDVQRARTALAHTIMNADEIWGPRRGPTSKDGPAGTAPAVLRAPPASPREKAVMTDIAEAVRTARAQRQAGIDPTNGATNFHMRSFRSTDPPPHGIARDPAYTFRAEGEPMGPYANDQGAGMFINIWHNPVATRRGR